MRACADFFCLAPHYLRRHSNLIHHAPRKNGRTEGEEREKKNEGRISKERNGLYNPELEHRGAAGVLAAAISHLFVGDKRLCRDFKCQNKD